jgi:hypothetical protein
MKKIFSVLILTSSMTVLNAQNKPKQNTENFKKDIDSVSYLIGNMIGGNVLNDLPEANKEMILKG